MMVSRGLGALARGWCAEYQRRGLGMASCPEAYSPEGANPQQPNGCAADALGHLVATKGRAVAQRKLRGL